MIFSPTKKQDMQNRANMLYAVEVCLKNGLTDTAKEIGVVSAKLADKIRSCDYSQEDATLARWKVL